MSAIIIGFISGIISGMGIGGGALLIPALVFIYDTQQKIAQGINLAYFIPTAVTALFIHIKNKNANIKTAIILGIFGIFGSVIGSAFAMKCENSFLRRMFGIFLLFIGIREIIKGIKSKKH